MNRRRTAAEQVEAVGITGQTGDLVEVGDHGVQTLAAVDVPELDLAVVVRRDDDRHRRVHGDGVHAAGRARAARLERQHGRRLARLHVVHADGAAQRGDRQQRGGVRLAIIVIVRRDDGQTRWRPICNNNTTN